VRTRLILEAPARWEEMKTIAEPRSAELGGGFMESDGEGIFSEEKCVLNKRVREGKYGLKKRVTGNGEPYINCNLISNLSDTGGCF